VSEQRWERRPELRVHLQALDRTAEFIAALREQVQAERQAHAETRRLLALQGRVEELEAKLALVEKKTSSGATPSTASSP
jgi:BMFP domain-containing protein YqiC